MKWIVGACRHFCARFSYFLHDTSDRTAKLKRAKGLRRKSTNWAKRLSEAEATTRPRSQLGMTKKELGRRRPLCKPRPAPRSHIAAPMRSQQSERCGHHCAGRCGWLKTT